MLMRMRIRKMAYLALLFTVLSGCSLMPNEFIQKVKQQLQSAAEEDNPYVLYVKNGYPEELPDQLYGETFERFFANPSWTYFLSEDLEHIVEFKGKMSYMDTEVTARLQFIVYDETDYFELGALSFNEVPQTELVKMAMLEKVFGIDDSTAYADDQPVETPNDNALGQEASDLDEYGMSDDLGEKKDAASASASGSFEDLYSGKIPGIPSAIGDNLRSVLASNDGLIEVKDDPYGIQILYPQYRYFINDADVDNLDQNSGALSSIVLLPRQTILDIKIGDTPNEIIQRWGTPDNIFEYDPELGEGEPYTIVYTFGDYILYIDSDSADSPSTYGFYKDNGIAQTE
ncbi:hypothetical protein [Paenibacillus sp. NPDC058071]|uniref:hypothetical protein n=1 Tax=Paenibacillus sp. NPDC058071 TaxID=3346326 RepID=UPI0036DE0498